MVEMSLKELFEIGQALKVLSEKELKGKELEFSKIILD